MAVRLHNLATDDDLHVPGYYQDSDPGAVGAGKLWIDTSNGTGKWITKIRNTSNTDWESILGINIEEGTADGQIPYWDNTNAIWKHSTHLIWDDTNHYLYLGDTSGENPKIFANPFDELPYIELRGAETTKIVSGHIDLILGDTIGIYNLTLYNSNLAEKFKIDSLGQITARESLTYAGADSFNIYAPGAITLFPSNINFPVTFYASTTGGVNYNYLSLKTTNQDYRLQTEGSAFAGFGIYKYLPVTAGWQLTILTNGNVGIGGIYNQDEKLVVNGNIKATGHYIFSETSAPSPSANKAILYLTGDPEGTQTLHIKFDDGTVVPLASNHSGV